MVVAYCNGKPNPRLGAELQAVLDRWRADGAQIELRDDAGRTLLLASATESDLGPELTEEEIQRIIAEPGAMPLADFWKKMGVR